MGEPGCRCVKAIPAGYVNHLTLEQVARGKVRIFLAAAIWQINRAGSD